MEVDTDGHTVNAHSWQWNQGRPYGCDSMSFLLTPTLKGEQQSCNSHFLLPYVFGQCFITNWIITWRGA